MDTSGRAVLLAGATVVIALLGMFATGVAFMYGLAIAAVLAVLLTLVASLTLLPALLAGRLGARLVRPARRHAGAGARRRRTASTGPRRRLGACPGGTGARRCRHIPGRSRSAALAVMIALLLPVLTLRLDSSDAGNDAGRHELTPAPSTCSPRASGPGSTARCCSSPNCRGSAASDGSAGAARRAQPPPPASSPSPSPASRLQGRLAVLRAYPASAPQAQATTNLVNHLRRDVLPAFEHRTGVTVLVGGFTASSIDFSHVLSNKLPLFLGS